VCIGLLDADHARGDVDVARAQPHELAAAKAGVERSSPDRLVGAR
jgi:hypothetical protein